MTSSYRAATRLGRNLVKCLLWPLLMPVLAGAASGQPAATQQSPAAQAGTAGGEVTPRGQREVKDIGFGDWRRICFKPGGAKMLCRTSITGTFPTGQTAIRVDLIEPEGGGASRLQLFAPVGMYLPAGVKLRVDDGKPHQAAYSWCLTNACIAATVADPKLIQELDSGQTLRLDFVDSNLLSLTTPLPLARFAAVRKAAPAQTFEQDIDE